MPERCRWCGCTRDSVTRVAKESPKVGEFDLPLCHRHAKRMEGKQFSLTETIGGEPGAD